MKRYPKYKDSGVKWIGEIPEHWEVLPIKRIAPLVKAKTEDKTLNYIALENIESYSGRLLSYNTSSPESDCNTFCVGDVLFNKLRPYLTKSIVAEFDGMCTSELLVLRTNQNNKFLNYVLLSPKLIDLINASTYGAKMPRANWTFIGGCNAPLPPLDEQQAIVAYLDEKVGKIDRYISEKEKEIVALDELKQATIANAVTRGLDPNAPLKDSGIKWIGNIPQHWEVKQMRNYLTLVSEKNHPEKQLLSVTREQGVIIRNTESKEENHNYIPDDLSGYKYVKEGQFVINKMKSWQGSYGVSDYEGIVSPAYYVCDLSFPCKEFFSKAVRSKAYIPFFTQYSKGIRVDQWDLSTIGLKTIPFIEPPIEEQQAIVDYINTKTAKIDQMKDGIKSEIEKLKEYKQRLISDVVTGKVRV